MTLFFKDEKIRYVSVPKSVKGLKFRINSITYSGEHYVETGNKLGLPIIIKHNIQPKINSAGGVGFALEWVNTIGKTIKYARFLVEAYNRVGDTVKGKISESSQQWLKDTGPHKPNEVVGSIWKNVWYNTEVTCVKVIGIKIEYMNNSNIEILDQERMKKCFYPGSYSACSYEEQESVDP